MLNNDQPSFSRFSRNSHPWKVLIVDDEPEVHELTKLVLRNLKFLDRKLELISAYSAQEAKMLCQEHEDAALILMDVVMETDDAGLQAVQYIREELKNLDIRIILRTGQAGRIPEKKVIVDYDINDYKEKTELTATKLFTTIISSLRTYKEILDRHMAEDQLREGRNQLRKHNEILVQLTQHKIQTMGNLDATLKEITETSAQTLEMNCVSIWLFNQENSTFYLKNRYLLEDQRYIYDDVWQPDSPATYLEAFNNTRVLITEDIAEAATPILGPAPVSDRTRSIADVPLRFRDDIIGLVRYEKFDKPRQWTGEEESFAASMTDFVALAISSLKHEEQVRQNTRMESELSTAAAVQTALLPRALPQVDCLEFASYFQSASETGGDWFGFLTDFEDHIYVLIGDVTGHGTPAALITATASATSRTLEEMYCLQNKIPSPAQLLYHLNESIYRTGHPNFLMTFFVAQINLRTGITIFSNAAHNFPLLLHADGSITPLLNRNPHLGYYQNHQFVNSETVLREGDTLLFYTDGLIENTNHHFEDWGSSRFKRAIKHHHHLSIQPFVNQIIQDAKVFYDNYPTLDDTTLIACRVTQPFR